MSRLESTLPSGLRGLCRAALLAYPRALRVRHLPEMEAVLAHRWNKLRGRAGARVRFVAYLARDVGVSLAGRVRSRRPGAAAAGDGAPGPRRGASDERGPAAWIASVAQDLRFGWRGLRRAPLFTVTAVVTLALGVGANAAIFSLVNAVLLRPLPYPDPDRIQRLMGGMWASARQVEALRESVPSFAALTGIAQGGFTLREDEPERVTGIVVWPEYFDVLGITPHLGRPLQEADTRPGAEPVVLLSHALWTRAFDADAEVIGRRVALEGEERAGYTVIGILPRGHDPFAWHAEVLVPALIERGSHAFEENFRYQLFARLTPTATASRAAGDLRAVVTRLAGSETPVFTSDDPDRASLKSLREDRIGDARSSLVLMLAAVGVVLLIACANVANLLLARAGVRHGEIAVRAALGAGRARIVRQLLTESVLLSLIGGALGLVLAWAGTGPLVATLPTDIPRQAEVRVDLGVLAFTLGASVAAGLLFGLAPALRAGRAGTSASGTTGTTSGGRSRNRLHGLLLATEVGLAVVLLVAASLLGKSLWRLHGVDPGFDPDHLVTFHLAPSAERYAEAAERADYYARVITRLRALPGVEAAGATSTLPVSGGVMGVGLSPDGNPVPEGQPSLIVSYRTVLPGTLETLGARLREGRLMGPEDDSGSVPTAVVNRRLAARLWPGESVVGKEMFWGSGEPWVTVVGVVDDIHQGSLTDAPNPEAYVSYAREGTWLTALHVLVRHQPGIEILPAARAAVWEVDADVPVTRQGTLREQIRASLSGERGWALVFGSFAGLALLLAAVGVYGVMSYVTTQRRHEVGVRVALGARRSDVVASVVRSGFRPVAAGLAVGAVAAALGGRVIEGWLHDVAPADPVVLAAVVTVLALVALAANLVPAWRAAGTDPVRALRAD